MVDKMQKHLESDNKDQSCLNFYKSLASELDSPD